MWCLRFETPADQRPTAAAVSVNPDEAGDVEGFSDDYDAGSDSAESVESGPDMDGTLDEMDSAIEA